MSDQVLTDEQRRAAYGLHDDEPNGLSDRLARVERAVVAALAARGGVDVEELAAKATVTTSMYGNATLEYGDRAKVADALRLALATAEARHEADDTYYDLKRERDSLRAQLAAAQRIPADAELDALVSELRSGAALRRVRGGVLRSDDLNNMDAASDAITALRRRVAELAVTTGDVIDAARYRYLRNDCAESSLGVYEWRGEMGRQVKSWLALHELDDAIDAAIAKEPQDA